MMYAGLGRTAWTKALEKSIEQVSCSNNTDRIRKILIVLKATTGANVSVMPVMRSPLKQMQAFLRLISPAGLRLRRNTQVAGIMASPLASESGTSIQTP